MRTVTLEVPTWVTEEEVQRETLQALKYRALWKLEYYKGQMQPFERKYGVSFEEFKVKVERASQENFEEWDDLIEWEAYHRAYEEWRERYEELEKCLGNS